ncbi:hypothetical protein AVEN_198709-1 [Araneus ventricosus]|uniref:Uncharacterized protein n=1 Tax=Araneus ventricosus TaxID=182803 RepID=A0A4Y2S4E5_ARAVE|nr:hypothetical protein AVEN_198709-1 [Araneus ventricosus]
MHIRRASVKHMGKQLAYLLNSGLFAANLTEPLMSKKSHYAPVPLTLTLTTPDVIDCNCGTDLWLLYKRAERTMKQSRLRTHSCTGADDHVVMIHPYLLSHVCIYCTCCLQCFNLFLIDSLIQSCSSFLINE